MQALGVDPAKVEHVIATHMHWDHAGNYDLFPQARYHVQDTEMAYCTGRCMCHPLLRIPFSESDVHAMVKKVFAYRVEFHDGADEIAPGITVHKIGGHSKGLQCVRVKTRAAMSSSPPTAAICIRTSTRAACSRSPIRSATRSRATRRWSSSPRSKRHVVPGHDPEVMTRYPAAKAGLEGWVARLDVEAKP